MHNQLGCFRRHLQKWRLPWKHFLDHQSLTTCLNLNQFYFHQNVWRSTFWKGVCSIGKEFASRGSKLFPFRTDPFQKELNVRKLKQGETKVISFVKNGWNSNKRLRSPEYKHNFIRSSEYTWLNLVQSFLNCKIYLGYFFYSKDNSTNLYIVSNTFIKCLLKHLRMHTVTSFKVLNLMTLIFLAIRL